MKSRALYALLAIAIITVAACAPKATPPPVDTIGTLSAQLAAAMLTQTVAAYSPTPPPTETPAPTATFTPEPTQEKNSNIITVVNLTGCYRGPGTNYPLQSNINVPKKVELLGIGSVPGWYIINGPYYYTPCWVAIADVQVGPDVDLSKFPVMTPGP